MKYSGQQSRGKINPRFKACSLVELLVALALFAMIMVLAVSIISQSSVIFRSADGKRINRQVARFVIEMVCRDLESALFARTSSSYLRFQLNPSTLETNYSNPNSVFFQTAIQGRGGTNGDIADVGYFVNWVIDARSIARSALCRISIPPKESESIFSNPARVWNSTLVEQYAPGLNKTNLIDPDAFKGLFAENVLGLWITLYDTNGVLAGEYDSRGSSLKPTFADVAVAVVDPQTAKRINPAMLASIKSAYSSTTNAESFIEAIPDHLRSGSQVFKTRVLLHNEN